MSKKKTAKKKVPPGYVEVFTPYIHRNGQVIWHPTGGVFRFFVKA